MNREEIIETIRVHSKKHGVVWLTERGAIVLAPNGEVDCIKDVGRDYFKDDSQLMFIEGVVGVSAIGTRSGESAGTGVLDERVHEGIWSEAENPQKATVDESDTRPPLEKLAELVAQADAMAPEQKKRFREENDTRIKKLLFQIALQNEARRICGEKVH
jgi:hypothetical protein